jgi:hypothetical protein
MDHLHDGLEVLGPWVGSVGSPGDDRGVSEVAYLEPRPAELPDESGGAERRGCLLLTDTGGAGARRSADDRYTPRHGQILPMSTRSTALLLQRVADTLPLEVGFKSSVLSIRRVLGIDPPGRALARTGLEVGHSRWPTMSRTGRYHRRHLLVTLYGVAALAFMMVMYWLEHRGSVCWKPSGA